MSSTSQNKKFDSSQESSQETEAQTLEHSKQFQSLRPLDAFIYQIEQNIVTLAALMMTLSVTLDIIFRALKGQSTQPAQALLSLFGLIPITQATPNPPWALVPPLLFGGLLFGLGWAVYSARQRELNQKLHQSKAIQVGLITLIGSWIFCILVLHLPSWLMCSILTYLGGLWWIKRAYDDQSWIQVFLRICISFFGVQLSFFTPQDYIWSQELSLILLAWMAFLGSSMATYQHKHIQISALAKLIPDSKKALVAGIGLIMTALFCLYVDVLLFESVFGEKGSFQSQEVRPATGLPAWIILASGIVAFTLMSLRSFTYGLYTLLYPHTHQNQESLH